MTNARADAKQEMMELVKRRTDVSIALANLEKQIYNFETTYLEEAMEHGGNVIKGFGKVLESVNGASGSVSAVSSASTIFTPSTTSAKQKKASKLHFSEMDRIFSLSSVTSPISSRLLELGTGIASSPAGEANSSNGLSRDNFLVNGDKPSVGRPAHAVRSSLHLSHPPTRKESTQHAEPDESRSDEERTTASNATAAVGRRGPAPKRRRTIVEH